MELIIRILVLCFILCFILCYIIRTIGPTAKKRRVAEYKLKNLGEFAIKNNNFEMLMSEFKNLTTFVEIINWKKKAELEILNINSLVIQIDNEICQYQKLFSSQHFNNVYFKLAIDKINSEYKVPLINMIEEIKKTMYFVPKSHDENQNLLKELKDKKKELQIQKREFTINMREIRRKARVESVNAGKILFRYNSKIAARERRGIRSHKEAQLRPYEDAVTAIERQLLQIDKDIIWLESLK